MKSDLRIEVDAFGSIEIPKDKYWGAQTQRAIINFPIGWELQPISIIHALGLVKKACAISNEEIGKLDTNKANAIIQAASEVVDGKFDDNFPLVVWQTGSGTQSNMNANEVIANRAIEILGGVIGSKDPIHPNDHCNMSQSSNDTFPSAIHIACATTINDLFLPALNNIYKTLEMKVKEFDGILKIGRTHMMDATPVTLSQEFSGYSHQIKMSIQRIKNVLPRIYEIAQGATAVGTGLNTQKGWDKLVIKNIANLTKLPFIPAPNKFEAIASHDTMVELSGAIKASTVSLFKIANDIRLLSSGPRGGLGELNLPENEPGSSIMPGKVNPTQIEALTQVCVHVFGNDAAIGFAGSQGHLELNTYKPMIAYNILQSLQLISDACMAFNDNCLDGLTPNKITIDKLMNSSLMLVTALTPLIGYDHAALIAKKAHKNGTSLKEEALKSGLIDEKTFDLTINPKKMISPE
ncbi:class II fumarate hydratase [Methylophilaceae bacterium]|nr:class II fumarate hydratase [Methylophilaceae bacterium]|tara:strand:- start:10258 stop:11652 length:1395 start_codon:yes stop_codon:yes gene_type:complete